MPKPIHLFTGDLRQEPTGVLRERVTSKCELLELSWNYSLQESRNGSMGDIGCMSFSNRQEGMCRHQLRVGPMKETVQGKLGEAGAHLAFMDVSSGPILDRERAYLSVQTRMYTHVL